MHFAFDEFGHILWGVKKTTIVMTDKKALTLFFHAKQIPSKLWNFCDQALQFNFLLAHVPGTENLAADYWSRLDIDPKHRIQLKLTDSTPVYLIDIDIAAKTPKKGRRWNGLGTGPRNQSCNAWWQALHWLILRLRCLMVQY